MNAKEESSSQDARHGHKTLKFRVWKDNTFIYSTDFTMFYEFFEQACPDEDKAQMFTGLIDKNGKEIYEGDVLGREFEPIEYDSQCARFSTNLPGARIFTLDEFFENGKPEVLASFFNGERVV